MSVFLRHHKTHHRCLIKLVNEDNGPKKLCGCLKKFHSFLISILFYNFSNTNHWEQSWWTMRSLVLFIMNTIIKTLGHLYMSEGAQQQKGKSQVGVSNGVVRKKVKVSSSQHIQYWEKQGSVIRNHHFLSFSWKKRERERESVESLWN